MILPSTASAGVYFAAVSAGAYLVASQAAYKLGAPLRLWVALLAWGLHGLALWQVMFGVEPLFGFATALSLTAWLVALVYAMEVCVYPALPVRWQLARVGAVAVLLGAVVPGKTLHAGASVWLPLHWALGIASYGLVAVAVVHAWFMTRVEDDLRLASHEQAGLPLMTLERLTFRFVQVGFALLTATITVAVLFGDFLYGAPAGVKWNHKALFSVLSWITFAVLLFGRARFGWRGTAARRMLYVGSGLLLLAYVGSRFVLEVVLQR
jgi:ABC-type uncharacterized transport system permease subunit